jgi:2-polyprenyl-3-methyl-5-hydroxy-6-metoxy-1,4-benzoquinol methylase
MPQRLQDLLQAARCRLGVGPWSREYFERRFEQRDPWSYETSSYEQRKYERSLELIPPIAGLQILEVGCAEGVFTALLAAQGSKVLGVDVCERALSRAAERCAGSPAVHFARLDISSDPVEGTFDVVMCAEVLYYLHHAGLRRARDRLVAALKPDGHMVLVHPSSDAHRVHPVVSRHPSLVLANEKTWTDSTRPYVITVFKKAALSG